LGKFLFLFFFILADSVLLDTAFNSKCSHGSPILCLSILCVVRWAAASGQISYNSMILPAALYFWQIPHFMALAHLCRNDYAAGG
jgi:hypothetical protein